MDRKYVREKVLPILQAFAEGKAIQSRCIKGDKSLWYDDDDDFSFDDDLEYRIKPSPTYRPFKDAEECWQEIEKHSFPGWIKEKGRGFRHQITSVVNTGCYLPYCNPSDEEESNTSYEQLLDSYTFIDGTSFGKLEEE